MIIERRREEKRGEERGEERRGEERRGEERRGEERRGEERRGEERRGEEKGNERADNIKVSRESDWALIYSSCPGALGSRQLDIWQFIEWLHDLATQRTHS
ncbi:unnamed protein product [Leuciscus chuanchicus]